MNRGRKPNKSGLINKRAPFYKSLNIILGLFVSVDCLLTLAANE